MANRTTLAGAIALALAATAAMAAPDTRYMTPPGLYRVEVVDDLTVRSPNGAISKHTTVDAATGNMDTRFRRKDGSGGTQRLAGDGAQEVCVQPTKSVELPKGLRIDGCNATKGQVISNAMVSVHNCPWGKITISQRQVNASTWERTMESVTTGVPGVGVAGDSYAVPRAMAEQAARTGNAKERAEAQEALAFFRTMAAEQKKMAQEMPPEAIAAMNGARSTGAKTQKSVMRMTRIGDCKG